MQSDECFRGFIKGGISPSDKVQHCLNLLEVLGHSWTVIQKHKVDRACSYTEFIVKIEVSGFGNFEGSSTITEDAAMAEAEGLFLNEYNKHFERATQNKSPKNDLDYIKSNQSSGQMGYRDGKLLATDLKWVEVLCAFRENLAKHLEPESVIQNLIKEQRIKEETKEVKRYLDHDKGNHSRFEVKIQSEKDAPVLIFKTEILIASVTIASRKEDPDESKKKAYLKTYYYLGGFHGILETFMKAPNDNWSVADTKLNLQKFIIKNRPARSADKLKIIQVFSGLVKKNGVFVHHSVCLHFLGENFNGTSVVSEDEAENEPYRKLFEYLMRLAYFINCQKTQFFSENKFSTNFTKDLQTSTTASSSIKSPYLLAEMQQQPLDFALPPSNPDMGIAGSRLKCIAEVVNSFLNVYRSDDSPVKIAIQFINLEEFTQNHKSENGTLFYTVKHDILGSFVGVGDTLEKALQIAHLNVYALMHKLVHLVLSYRLISNTENSSSACWLKALIDFNPELVEMKFREKGPSKFDATLTIAVLLSTVRGTGNNLSECQKMLANQIGKILKIFSSQIIASAGLTRESFKANGPKTGKQAIYRLPVPVFENNEQKFSINKLTGQAKLMELIIRFKQIYAAKKQSLNGIEIIKLLKQQNKQLFSRTSTSECMYQNHLQKFNYVFVVHPLGSFSGNGYSRGQAIKNSHAAAFNRLLELKRIVYKLLKVDLSSVTQEEVDEICSDYSYTFVFKANVYEKKVVLQLSHFFTFHVPCTDHMMGRIEAFRTMVKAIFQLYEEALQEIYREDNRVLPIIKTNKALAEANSA
ncbi:hypothetical protein TYRP_003270 [Tyrophagus putrescentiae]|nr:hypothetical protein TYRP_003270 [Tyrophagus putrescentiae]